MATSNSSVNAHRTMCDDCNDVLNFPCNIFHSELEHKKGIYSSMRNSCIKDDNSGDLKCYFRPCICCEDCCKLCCGGNCTYDCSLCACCLCNCVSYIAKGMKQTSDPDNNAYRSCVHYIPPLCSACCATCVCIPLLCTIPLCGSNCICSCVYEYTALPSCSLPEAQKIERN